MSVRIDAAIPVSVSASEQSFALGISEPQTIDIGVDTDIVAAITEHYRGSYAVTPGDDAQTLQTSGKFMEGDVVIAPIPNNYGLIAWDGSVLTVS